MRHRLRWQVSEYAFVKVAPDARSQTSPPGSCRWAEGTCLVCSQLQGLLLILGVFVCFFPRFYISILDLTKSWQMKSPDFILCVWGELQVADLWQSWLAGKKNRGSVCSIGTFVLISMLLFHSLHPQEFPVGQTLSQQKAFLCLVQKRPWHSRDLGLNARPTLMRDRPPAPPAPWQLVAHNSGRWCAS